MENKKISFVIPCYKSSQTIGPVITEIEETMETLEQYSYEVILVNGPEHIKELVEKYHLLDEE